MCLSCSLPFYSIDDLEFHFIFGNFNRLPCDELMDRLTAQLKFNPLDFDNNITNARHFENYMPENLDCLTSNYYLPNAVINSDSKKLSILNLNIRSMANKFDSFRNLLNTLIKTTLFYKLGLMTKIVKISILVILILFVLTEKIEKAAERDFLFQIV
jgi:hypothetical protein